MVGNHHALPHRQLLNQPSTLHDSAGQLVSQLHRRGRSSCNLPDIRTTQATAMHLDDNLVFRTHRYGKIFQADIIISVVDYRFHWLLLKFFRVFWPRLFSPYMVC
jgi:hypothetical protein